MLSSSVIIEFFIFTGDISHKVYCVVNTIELEEMSALKLAGARNAGTYWDFSGLDYSLSWADCFLLLKGEEKAVSRSSSFLLITTFRAKLDRVELIWALCSVFYGIQRLFWRVCGRCVIN